MKLPHFLLPLLVVLALTGGYLLRNSFIQPTTQVAFGGTGEQTMTCTVQGVKCKGTANFFTRLYQDAPGIASIETFATEHRVVFSYDPALITPARIREIMEAPIPLRDGTSRQVFTCLSVE